MGDWCSALLVNFRGADPPSCDVKTGLDSRWRLQYDVYQYFLPENDLTEEVLLRHLQRMAEVPQVRANAIKVSLIPVTPVARLWPLCKSWEGEKLPGAYYYYYFYCFLGLSRILILSSLISLSSWESMPVTSQSNIDFWGDACKYCYVMFCCSHMFCYVSSKHKLWLVILSYGWSGWSVSMYSHNY